MLSRPFAWTSNSLNIPGDNLYGGLTEFVGGVQAGYNIQYGHLLFGVAIAADRLGLLFEQGC